MAAGDSFSATTLTWTPPTTNTNGTPLTDLAGYDVHYGTSSGNYTSTVSVGNVTSYSFTGLPSGTYYFAATAYDSAGNQSAYSNEISETVTSQYTLTVADSGTGSGTVTSSPAGINRGSTCSNLYNSGSVLTLTATPTSNATFAGWSGGSCTGTGTC